MKVDIKNFQSISNAELDFDFGLIAITGPNSSGKSAIFRALRAVIQNPPSAKHSVKKGTKRTEVSISGLPNTPTVTWARTPTESSYQTSVQGEFKRAGRNDVFDFLPSFPLRLEGSRLLNFQTEWDTLFPFEKSNTELYTLFEHIFSVVDSSSIISIIKSDEKATKDKITQLTNELNRLVTTQQILQKYFPQELTEQELVDVIDNIGKTLNYAEGIHKASVFVGSVDSITSKWNFSTPFPSLDAIPYAITLSKKARASVAIGNILQHSNIPSIQINKEPFEKAIKLENDARKLSAIESVLERASIVSSPIDGSPLEAVKRAQDICSSLELIYRLDSILSTYGHLRDMSLSSIHGLVNNTITSLPPLDKQMSCVPLLQKIEQEIDEITNELDMVNSELQKLKQEISKINVCPLCGAPINHDQSHE